MNCVIYLQSPGPNQSSQRIMHLAAHPDATPTVLVDPAALVADDAALPAAERAHRERLRESATGITAFSAEGRFLSFALGGRIHVVDIDSREVTVIPASRNAISPQLAPTGHRVAWVQDSNVWCAHIDGSHPRQLTDAGPDETWGIANFLAAEEFDRMRGFWWSPDGTELIAEHVMEDGVTNRYLSDPTTPTVAPRVVRYPAAGGTNPTVRLWRLNPNGGASELIWDRTQFEYVVSVCWTSRGPALINLYRRDQRHSAVFALQNDELTTVATATDDSWISDLPGTPNWTTDGQLITTVRDANSETIAIDSVPIQVGTAQVTALLAVITGGLIVEIAPTAPTRTVVHVTTNGDVSPLAPTSGYCSGVFGETSAVLTQSDLTSLTTRRELCRWQAGKVPTCVANIADLSLTPPVTLNIAHLQLGPDELETVVIWPYDHVPGNGPLPVILNPYGGPHAQRVLASGRLFARAQWLADQGYAVVIADGHGSPGRGPQWERSIDGDFVTDILADQVTVVTELAFQYPADIDLSRVGIAGWSFGGYLAALAVMGRPDIFRCAVAGAPVTDWRWYDSAYTERYLGLPSENPAQYEQSSLLPLADKLIRPLMLIHGLADDNVFAQHSLALSARLTAAGIRHTFLPLPNVSHMTPQEDIAENLLVLELEFFNEHLRAH